MVMKIKKQDFNQTLFVWCLIDDSGQVICCRKSESEAQKELASFRGGRLPSLQHTE